MRTHEHAIIRLEVIPDALKVGNIVPIYKGGGKDPLDVHSYRGITLTSGVAKVLEFLLLDRLKLVLLEAGLPHINQSAYMSNVSCTDDTQEVVARYVREGSDVYMCLYDLQKAFDSVEYCVLLERLFSVGVNGRMWQLLRSWYDNVRCRVCINGNLSSDFIVQRGVRLGSVLSPTLFLLVMNPLLIKLQASGLGPSINNFYAGGFLYADDIRTLATSESTLRAQVSMVQEFAKSNYLKLNYSKCEIVLFSRRSIIPSSPYVFEGTHIPISEEGKCIGYWWRGDLLATRAIDDNMRKARRAFFLFGSIGVFHGDLSPLSSVSILETCVILILLYGSENWIMTESLMKSLESFQGELAKRILKWPKHHLNTAAIVALELPTMRCRILLRKLPEIVKG